MTVAKAAPGIRRCAGPMQPPRAAPEAYRACQKKEDGMTDVVFRP
jgi:hypothetical protein